MNAQDPVRVGPGDWSRADVSPLPTTRQWRVVVDGHLPDGLGAPFHDGSRG
ncbi:hypothetical protein [Streptomyces sp. NPDC050504]|uniref:hypothetical protein n=1 Tax=Streptomyces sp. NPDC050504 TaxID=3365618 RepID=UPI00378FFBEC